MGQAGSAEEARVITTVSRQRQDYLRRLGIQHDRDQFANGASQKGTVVLEKMRSGKEHACFLDAKSSPVIKNQDDFRRSLLRNLSHQRVLIPKAARPPRYQVVTIFEWDDTLLCSSFLKSCPEQIFPASVGHNLRGIEAAAQNLLRMAMRMGHAIIITNAEPGWVEYSAAKYMPELIPLLQKVQVISARGRYELMFPNDASKWKINTFLEVQRQLDSQIITKLISLGSSAFEMDAVNVMGREFTQAVVQTIKFPEKPSPQGLLEQLQLVSENFQRTVEEYPGPGRSVRLLSGDEVTVADCKVGDSVGNVLLRLRMIRPPPSNSHYVLVHAGQKLREEESLTTEMLSCLAALVVAHATKDNDAGNENDDAEGDDGSGDHDSSANTSERGEAVRDTEGNAGTEAPSMNALSTYLLACAHGEPPAELPPGYKSGHGCVGCLRTGVTVRSPPIQLTPRSHADVILYHYTDEAGFSAITGQKGVKHLRASYAERAHFGDGIYASQFPPHFFASKEHILRNNYTNSSDPEKVESQLKFWRQKGSADYCVPLAVSRNAAVNVSIEETKEMTHPGCTLLNGPMRSDRDIWVVVISQDGKVTHGYENLDAVYNRLGSSDYSMRLDAVEILAGHAARGDIRASTLVRESLHDDDFNVRTAAIWAVVGTTLLSATEKVAAITQLAQQEPVSSVLDSVKDALSFLQAL